MCRWIDNRYVGRWMEILVKVKESEHGLAMNQMSLSYTAAEFQMQVLQIMSNAWSSCVKFCQVTSRL